MNSLSCTACTPASTSAAASSPFSALAASKNPSTIASQFFGMMQFLQHANIKESSPALMNGMHARFQTLTAQDAQSLQSLLAGVEGGDDAAFPHNVLLALTVGVPAELLPEGVEANADGVVSLTFDQLSELVSSHSDALSNGNILLVAANIAPEDMEGLADSLSEALEKMKSAQTDIATGSQDQNGEDVHLVLVTMTLPEQIEAGAFENISSNEIAQDQSRDSTIDVNWIALSNFLADATPKSISNKEGSLTSGEKGSIFAPHGATKLHGEEAIATGNKSADTTLGTPSPSSSSAKEHGAKLSLELPDDSKVGSCVSFKDFVFGNGQKIGFDMGNALGLLGLAPSSLPAASSSNPLLANSSAVTAHPATQTLTAILEKISENGKIKTQTLSVELDPPELGRVQIHLSLERGEPMKVRVVTEKEETLAVLRRDSHALRQALDAAGVQTDGSSLSFDMSQDSSAFGQTLAQQQDHGEKHRSAFMFGDGEVSIHNGPVTDVTETALGIVIDEQTGRVGYNILA